MKQYFFEKEDFNRIINQTLKKRINKIEYITNGWTNFVFQVYTNKDIYYFRFPRDEFWAKAIVKECSFSQYISGKTKYKTVDLILHKDSKNRYFSVHKKIQGVALADIMNSLNLKQIKNISYQISDFMYQLHNIQIDDNFYLMNNEIKLVKFLDELLSFHIDKSNRGFWNIKDRNSDESNEIVHGDLNASNVILDENYNVSGIIDLSFVGLANKYYDIARIIGRCNPKFKKYIIESYEKISGKKLDSLELENKILLWNQIDNSYINYMKKAGIVK